MDTFVSYIKVVCFSTDLIDDRFIGNLNCRQDVEDVGGCGKVK